MASSGFGAYAGVELGGLPDRSSSSVQLVPAAIPIGKMPSFMSVRLHTEWPHSAQYSSERQKAETVASWPQVNEEKF